MEFNRWLEDVLTSRLDYNQELIGERIYTRHAFRSDKTKKIFEPYLQESSEKQIQFNLYFFDLCQTQKQAKIIRKAIVDENIPVKHPLMCRPFWFDGGRMWEAFFLGRIRYWEALPELVEAATHDLDNQMRLKSVEAIAQMGKLDDEYVIPLAQRLKSETCPITKEQIVYVMGKSHNSICIPTLIQIFRSKRDEILSITPTQFHDQNNYRVMNHITTMYENAFIGIKNLNLNLAMEELAKSDSMENDLLKFHTKRATQRAGMRRSKKLIIPRKDL